MAGATDQGGQKDAGPGADAPRASAGWSIPEIRIVKDDQGRLRIDQTDPATYGAQTASQFLATAKADPRYRDGMTKRPSAPSIRLTYVDETGDIKKLAIREIFCKMDGDALVLTHFENAEGEKVKDLPVAVPPVDDLELDTEVDNEDRLHALAMAELGLGDEDSSPAEEVEPEPEAAPPEPVRERRMPTGP
ncbi:hypothetical protein ACYOEI_17090, partial [Singulisphaera rosea]